jgi:hypothetical protein
MTSRPSRHRQSHLKDKPFLAWVRTQSSIVPSHDSKCKGCRVTAHHVRRYGEPKDDRRAVPLFACRHMHGFGDETVEHSKKNFEARFHVDLEQIILRLNRQYERKVAA